MSRPNRVIANHIRALAADTPRDVLAAGPNGPCLVDANSVLAAGSTVERILYTHSDLLDGASAAGQTLAAYVRGNAGRIAATINEAADAATGKD